MTCKYQVWTPKKHKSANSSQKYFNNHRGISEPNISIWITVIQRTGKRLDQLGWLINCAAWWHEYTGATLPLWNTILSFYHTAEHFYLKIICHNSRENQAFIWTLFLSPASQLMQSHFLHVDLLSRSCQYNTHFHSTVMSYSPLCCSEILFSNRNIALIHWNNEAYSLVD